MTHHYKLGHFEYVRRAGYLTAECLDRLIDIVVPGIITQEINDFVHEFGIKHGAVPASLNYRGYPKSCCTSVNHVVCHGIPGPQILREGDIVNIDVAFVLDGWHGDASRMYAVGNIKPFAERLIITTYEAMMRGIKAVKPGNTTADIGYAIASFAEREHCSVVRDFCGHGTNLIFHDKPNILHYGSKHSSEEDKLDAVKRGTAVFLEPGMIFTVEPMINLGRPSVKILQDGWTAITRDRSLSAQFEHTVGVTEIGVEIFTVSPRGLKGSYPFL